MGIVNKLEVLKDMVQEAIDQGATTVEDVHRTIAAVPFEMLEKRGLLEQEEAEEQYEKHVRTVGSVYDAIRDVNESIGEMASDMFEKLEDSKNISKTMDEKDK